VQVCSSAFRLGSFAHSDCLRARASARNLLAGRRFRAAVADSSRSVLEALPRAQSWRLVAAQVALTFSCSMRGCRGQRISKSRHAGRLTRTMRCRPIPRLRNARSMEDRAAYFGNPAPACGGCRPQVVGAGISTNRHSAVPGWRQKSNYGQHAAESPKVRRNFRQPEFTFASAHSVEQGTLWEPCRKTMRGCDARASSTRPLAAPVWRTAPLLATQIQIGPCERQPLLRAPLRKRWLMTNYRRCCRPTRSAEWPCGNPLKPGVYIHFTPMWRFNTNTRCARGFSRALLRHIARRCYRSTRRRHKTMNVRETRRLDYRSAGLRASSAWWLRCLGIFSILALALARGCAVPCSEWFSDGVATRTTNRHPHWPGCKSCRRYFASSFVTGRAKRRRGGWPRALVSIAFDKMSTKWVNERSRDQLILAG